MLGDPAGDHEATRADAHDADPGDRNRVPVRWAHNAARHGLGGEGYGQECEEREGENQGLNFPKSCGSIFSRYSLSLSASSEGLGEGSSVSTPF